jgi:hypothetical protein
METRPAKTSPGSRPRPSFGRFARHMIVYRHADPRFPFLWEDASQPPARWHGPGEGPVQYFADTPDGAWAEFLRHEDITDEAELVNVRRALWAIELPDDLVLLETPGLSQRVLTGGIETYEACQREARRLRAKGAKALRAISGIAAWGSARLESERRRPVRGRARRNRIGSV